jgi:hypothetical protein
MNGVRALFGSSLSVALALACGTSSNNNPADSGGDGSTESDTGGGASSGAGSGAEGSADVASGGDSSSNDGDSASNGDGDGASSMCLAGQSTCPKEDECCLLANYPVSGSCVGVGTCSTGYHFQCRGTADCAAGQVCCGTVTLPAAYDPSGLSADADADAALNAFLALVAGSTAKAICAASCAAPAQQLCILDDAGLSGDCANLPGTSCGPYPIGPLASYALIAAIAAGEPACVPADAGLSPTDSTTEAGPSEAGPSEAGDAPSGG